MGVSSATRASVAPASRRPVQRRAGLQRQQPAGQGDGAHLGQHPRHVGVAVDRDAALDTVGGIGLGQGQGPGALRHALHADAEPRRIHHGEHGIQPAIGLAHQLRLGALEQHDAGGGGMDAELLLDPAAAQPIGGAVRQHLGRGEEADAPRPRRRIRQPGEDQVQGIGRQVVVAPGDVDLLPGDAVAAGAVGLRLGPDLRQVAAGLGLGQAHGPGPFAGDQLRQPGLLLRRGGEAGQRLDRAGGQQGAEAEGHVAAGHQLGDRHPQAPGAAPARRSAMPLTSAGAASPCQPPSIQPR